MPNVKEMDAKQIAGELARQIFHKNGDHQVITVLAHKLGFSVGDDDETYHLNSVNKQNSDGSVGPWKPELRNGRKVFMRQALASSEDDRWCSRTEILPKKSKKRILMIGESVARGYFYEPHFTPSISLEYFLNKTFHGQEFEVIDLACTSIYIDALKKLCQDACVLEPDAIVILAGNNWGISLFENMKQEVLFKLVSALNGPNRFDEIQATIDNELQRMTESFLNVINSLKAQKGIPIVVVIPEYNMKDWLSNEIEQSYLCPDDKFADFLAVKAAALDAMKKGDWSSVASYAMELISLNKANPIGFELRAQSSLHNGGKVLEARESFERAKDCAMYHLLASPRCYTIIQRTLRHHCQTLNITTVDLPEIFLSMEGQHALPGREIFLDYCHFSIKGINTSMAAVATKLGEALIKTSVPIETILLNKPDVSVEIQGLGSLLAAIHNAHWGQRYEIILHHCTQAAKSCKKVRDALVHLAKGICHSVPVFVTKTFYHLKLTGLFDHDVSLKNQLIDLDLAKAIDESLKLYKIDISEAISIIRRESHGKQPISDLLNKYYTHSTFKLPREDRAYFIALNPTSTFYVINNDADVSIEATYRMPKGGRSIQDLQISLNGDAPFISLPFSRTWRKETLTVPNSMLQHGVNTLSFHWPQCLNYLNEIESLEEGEDLQQFYLRCILPTFGEIQRLIVHRDVNVAVDKPVLCHSI